MPCTEQTADYDKFTEMVSSVVGDEKSFAEEVLAVAPAEWFEEVGAWVLNEGLEVFEVGANGSDGFGPVRGPGGSGDFGQ